MKKTDGLLPGSPEWWEAMGKKRLPESAWKVYNSPHRKEKNTSFARIRAKEIIAREQKTGLPDAIRQSAPFLRKKLIFDNWQKDNYMNLKKHAEDQGMTNSNHLGKTVGWQVLLEQVIPEELLVARHKELLNKRIYREEYDKKTKTKTLVDMGPDVSSVTRALDMAYKLTGKYQEARKNDVDRNLKLYDAMLDAGVREEIRNFEDSIKERIYAKSNKEALAQYEVGVRAGETHTRKKEERQRARDGAGDVSGGHDGGGIDEAFEGSEGRVGDVLSDGGKDN